MKIGFIGLGIMGTPMALHLIGDGHQLFVNTVGPMPDAVAASSAVVCAHADEVTRQAEVVFIMVPDTPDVEAVLFGANGVASALQAAGGARKVIVDMSSISPMATKAFAQKINALGADYIDAPVSGGEVGAKAASLTIMCGGDPAVFERVRPLFEKMGKNITLVGGNGDGQTCKVANQIIVALNIAAVGEALLFASKAGADPAKVRQALMGGFAVEPHPRGARRAHDQANLRTGLSHPAAPEGSRAGAAGGARTGAVAAADGERGAADAGLRRQRHGRARPFGAGQGAGTDGRARSRAGLIAIGSRGRPARRFAAWPGERSRRPPVTATVRRARCRMRR